MSARHSAGETEAVPTIDIDLSAQRLRLEQGGRILFECPVSTAGNGPGEAVDSECTPRGWHVIHEKIGADCPPNTVFVGREPTGETYGCELAQTAPGRDWILTRILWLSGLEPGRNQGGDVDTLQRYIYLHGCPDETELGSVGSRGCVRLRNSDIVSLFEQVQAGTRVYIHE